jgi:CubicO group peptidase (beta-lactamase class C family)
MSIIVIMIREVKDERFKSLRSKMKEYVSQQELPNIITIVYQNGEIINCEKQGMADIENKIPIEFDNIFRIASMTKPIVSVAALMLYEENKFTLDDPLSKFIPKAKALKVFKSEREGNLLTEELSREVQIFDLFTHTGGFSYLSDPNHPVDKKFSGLLKEKKSLAEAINALFDVPLRSQPGTKWLYSFSTDILGYLIEVISGIPLDKFLQERIFGKLGMKDTGFFVPEEKWDRLVRLYTKDNKGRVILAPKELQLSVRENPRVFSGGGGLVSTLSDFMKFAIMLLNKGRLDDIQILKQETVQLMTQDHVLSRDIPYVDENSFGPLPEQLLKLYLELARGSGFGLGVKVLLEENITPKGTHGWGGAFATDYLVDPKNNVICIFFSQIFPTFSSNEIYAMTIRKLIYEGLNS